jgi:hypothetical protein
MSSWQINDLEINTDAVLRGQGADPVIIRSRSPYLVEIAERASDTAIKLVVPQVLSRKLNVVSIRHDKLKLENGIVLTGPLVTQHLVAAEAVIAVVCTIGSKIDLNATEVMATDMVLGLAIDGVGSAAVEALANTVCRDIELRAAEDGLMTTIPLSPGMIGWPVEQGQPVIFEILEPAKIGIELTPHNIMVPRKSLSMLIGLGSELDKQGSTCDFCAMREACRYQDHYRQTQNG